MVVRVVDDLNLLIVRLFELSFPELKALLFACAVDEILAVRYWSFLAPEKPACACRPWVPGATGQVLDAEDRV
jgi:hypothetical protein